MNVGRTKPKGIKIALRIALLTWQVTFMTIVIFVLVIIPQQKRTFIQNLHSKANSVAVSLHDVAAGAAVNEDYASVVSASETLLKGDPDLDFLIIIKNDGFSIINEQKGWRVEPDADGYFLPDKREAVGAIQNVPFLNQRVFHYAQPFDYSGIEWGWIHVGLSLKGYNQSVKSIYLNTLQLALACIFFSLLVSLVYAKALVRPIHHLREVVQRVTGGDLTVRAEVIRRDELGNLGDSINIMTEALLRRNYTLESVRFAAQQFLLSRKWEDVISVILGKIGQATSANRACIFENHLDDENRLLCSLRHEWVAQGVSMQLHKPDLQSVSYSDIGLEHWIDLLSQDQPILGSVSEMSPEEQAVLVPRNILSVIIIPIFSEGSWWGFLELDNCEICRIWTDADQDSLRTIADMLGTTIARQGFQEALLESKATLEQRVLERTRELQDQVQAKEKALAELAEAQSSLVEVSRAAGMAEVATGVLHNVGNVLNSVNVSCTLLRDQLRESRVGNVSRVAALIAEPESGLVGFLSDDPRGRQIPAYLASLGSALQEEHQVMSREAESLHEKIEHIKEIVTMQQTYGRVSGVKETVAPEQLMEDALKLNAGSLIRHSIKVQRHYEPVSPITVDKHKILQILINLVNNAKHACTDGGNREKIITLRIFSPGADRLNMQVADNGMGILPENLTRIFQHGFTTRRSGHGFGLHSGALAAKELGGRLSVHSDGPGFGATFTLELAYQPGVRT